MNERGFEKRTADLYVRSNGNLVRRGQSDHGRYSVWTAVVGGVAQPGEHRQREDAELAVLAAADPEYPTDRALTWADYMTVWQPLGPDDEPPEPYLA